MDKESQQIFGKEIQENTKKEEINNNNGLFPGNEVQTENKTEKIDNTKNIKKDMTEKDTKELKKEKAQLIHNNELPPENEIYIKKESKKINNNKYNNGENLTLNKEKKEELNKNLSKNNNFYNVSKNKNYFDSNKNNQRNKEVERQKEKELGDNDLIRVEINNDEKKDIDKRKRRPKGYVRLFRKIIKKKNEILMKIFQGRFKKWKDVSLKGIHFKKTIIVRISVSRDKDEKDKFKTQENFSKYRRNKNTEDNLNKNNYIKSANDNLRKYRYYRNNEDNLKKDKYNQKTEDNLERDKHIKKSEFKPYKNTLKSSNDNNKKTFEYKSKYNINNNNSTELKNNSIFMTPKENRGNKIGIYDKYKTNNSKDIYILTENREDKSYLQTKKNDNYENKRLYYPKNNLNQDKNNIQNNRTIPNNEQKNYNNVSSREYIYKRNDEKNIFEKKIDNKYKRLNNNEKNNTQTSFYVKRNEYANQKNISTPNKNFKTIETNANQSIQRQNIKLNSINQYNTKKYIPPKKTTSEKKPKTTISYLNNTYQRSNNDKLLHTVSREDYKKKPEYQNFTYNRNNKTFDRSNATDKPSLKKGITSVVQHYSGVKKQLDNYDYKTTRGFN